MPNSSRHGCARVRSRALPQPVRDHGGLRVDSNLPHEATRWVFAEPSPAIRTLAAQIDQPRYFLKLIGAIDDLRALVDARWQAQPQNYLMTCAGGINASTWPADGYTLTVETIGPNSTARIHDRSGGLAANGHAAEFAGVFVYDRIVTDPRHRRRGLGRQMMAALAAARKSRAATQVLVATDEGRALYAALGWSVRSPYASVTIPLDACE